MLLAAPLLSLVLATSPSDALALAGNDPVLLCRGEEVAGRKDLTLTHGRYTYAFADEESLAEFRSAPERWAIQWGGGCARMGPLSGAGDPARWTVYREHVFVFASDACRESFRSSPERYFVPAAAAPAMTGEELEAGALWMARAVEAHGGAGALEDVRAVELVHESVEQGWKHRAELVVERGGALTRRSGWQPPNPEESGYLTTWRLEDGAAIDEGAGERALTSPEQLADLARFGERELFTHLWASREPGHRAAHRGRGRLGELEVENVLVWHAGLATTLHLDPVSGRVLGLSWTGRANDGVTREVVETFTEFRPAGALVLPTARTVTADGTHVSSLSRPWTTVRTVPGRD